MQRKSDLRHGHCRPRWSGLGNTAHLNQGVDSHELPKREDAGPFLPKPHMCAQTLLSSRFGTCHCRDSLLRSAISKLPPKATSPPASSARNWLAYRFRPHWTGIHANYMHLPPIFHTLITLDPVISQCSFRPETSCLHSAIGTTFRTAHRFSQRQEMQLEPVLLRATNSHE